jgi:hypothetical protein
MEKSTNMESQGTEKLTNTESQVTKKSANTESWVIKNLANTGNQVMQDSRSRKSEDGKGASPRKRPAPTWCPRGITKTQKHRLQKMRQRELAEKKEEEEWDYWFNCLWPMTKPKQTWQEKWLTKEEGGNNGDGSGREASKVTPARGEDNPGLGDGNPESSNYNLDSGGYHPELGNCNSEKRGCHPKLGNSNPDSGNSNLSKENDWQGEKPVPMDVNMVFTIPTEFHALTEDVAELVLGTLHAVFEKPENSGAHMKPLFIRGHLDGAPIGHMLIDGGASINILLLSLFKKIGHVEGDLKRTNLSLSGFADDPTEAKGIICKEVTVGSKTMCTTFFVVDVKGCYNVQLGWDCIHSNECVPSTLHQCVIQWIGDELEVVPADEEVCIAVAESQVDNLGGKMECLSSKDLMGYDYISIGKDGFVPINVKPVISATRLAHDL